MRTFELNIFIESTRNKVYDHLSVPINMIGLQPLLTEMDVLEETKDELEFLVYSKPNIEIVFKYSLKEFNDKRTQITQTVQFIKLNRLLESFIVRQANQAQRALLSNLKVRLEKK